MYVGVDCGTQSTKVVIVDAQLRIVGEGHGEHQLISGPHGRSEQQPAWWIDAFEQAFAAAIAQAGIAAGAIRAIGVSGQQHGMVALDAQGVPVYPGKLWNDTESAAENTALIEALGGPAGCLDKLGLILQPGYTASKVAWLRKHHRAAYDRIATILLPHDYLNFHLTGERCAEAGDASGTGYFDTRRRVWREDVFALIAPELDPARVLPRLIGSREPAGRVRAAIAERLGLARDVVVSSGGGDNMMGAIGTGNIAPGTLTLSLGTSGALYACTDRPAVSGNGLVANFCASHGGWLPLVCTMNVTSATTLVRQLFGLDVATFNAAVAQAPIGAGGVIALPFFSGERVPSLPEASGSFFGLSGHNLRAENLCRAVIEGATFGLRYGLDLLGEFGIAPHSIRLIGGGAKSATWRQIVADVMNAELACPQVGEAAALGAALQAAWCESHLRGEDRPLGELCAEAVGIHAETVTRPRARQVALYAQVYATYRAMLQQQYPSSVSG
jgi:xylulokinase